MLDDYTKADFPLDLKWSNGGCMVRLYGAIGSRVIGASFRVVETDNGMTEEFSQSLDWDGQGIFGSGNHSSMNLPPPPAKVATRVAELRSQIAAARNRLISMPDAPDEWRSVDERAITRAEAQIAEMEG